MARKRVFQVAVLFYSSMTARRPKRTETCLVETATYSYAGLIGVSHLAPQASDDIVKIREKVEFSRRYKGATIYTDVNHDFRKVWKMVGGEYQRRSQPQIAASEPERFIDPDEVLNICAKEAIE